jgi:hypothetical protein
MILDRFTEKGPRTEWNVVPGRIFNPLGERVQARGRQVEVAGVDETSQDDILARSPHDVSHSGSGNLQSFGFKWYKIILHL